MIDSPGDTENNQNIELFASKGYQYSKMLFYLMSEESLLDKNSIGNNEKLKDLIKLRTKSKIPLLILLTHSDTYCDKIKLENHDWKEISKTGINNNKTILLNYVNEFIKTEMKSDFKMEENDIIHIVLIESNQIPNEEIVNSLPNNLREQYDNGNDQTKQIIISAFGQGVMSTRNEINNFIRNEMKILGQKEFVQTIKEKLPSQYHSALIEIN